MAANKTQRELRTFFRNVFSFSYGGIGKRAQKRGLNLWHVKDARGREIRS